MDQEPDVIRGQIEQTRSSLTDKLETLEEQVKETVSNVTQSVESTIENVKSKVQGTVETVKSTVEETVATVKRTFDLSYQTERHPYAMTGGSLFAGMLLGYALGGRRPHRAPARYSAPPSLRGRSRWDEGLARGYEPASPAASAAAPAAAGLAPGPQEPGLLSRLLEPFASEIDKIKHVAMGGLLGMARDAIKRAVPPALVGQVEEIMNDLTRKLGGEPVRGPVLPEHADGPERAHDGRH